MEINYKTLPYRIRYVGKDKTGRDYYELVSLPDENRIGVAYDSATLVNKVIMGEEKNGS